MDENQPIDAVLASPQRKLVVANKEIDLSNKDAKTIFILIIEESQGSAGGRGGGSGSRRINEILAFSCARTGCTKFFESHDMEEIEHFEIPYSAVALDIKLSTGIEVVVQGLIDPHLVQNYQELISQIKGL